jgi:hypothetical protein
MKPVEDTNLEEMLYKERQRGGGGGGGGVARHESYALNTEFEEGKGPGRRASGRSSDASGYVFPERRKDPGERDWDREHHKREKDREPNHGSPAGSLHSSPSFDQHHLSTSAVRLESGPSHSHVHGTTIANLLGRGSDVDIMRTARVTVIWTAARTQTVSVRHHHHQCRHRHAHPQHERELSIHIQSFCFVTGTIFCPFLTFLCLVSCTLCFMLRSSSFFSL